MSDKTSKSVSLKVAAVLGAGVLVAGGFLGAYAFPTEKVVTKEVPVDKIVNVEKLVEVDNGNLALVEQFIYDSEGNLNVLDVTDLNDDEVSLIADRIVFVNELKTLAEQSVKSDLADALEDVTTIGGYNSSHVWITTGVDVNFDEKEISRVRIGTDVEDMQITGVDFDDKDALATVKGTFYDSDTSDKYNYEAEVTFKDGEADDFEVTSVTLA
jgi:hypothetical protein